ncbi:hypothetical protein OUZ56_026501 [Daphnia magna]|uniref:Uncharacterized protein n=1 Tax=Daphnia magna TaxID=35525 RepID=A0ABQ9ZM21_9CRUS|nr:hypothetical protein OUZ56_026501 [Daphnia magna]
MTSRQPPPNGLLVSYSFCLNYRKSAVPKYLKLTNFAIRVNPGESARQRTFTEDLLKENFTRNRILNLLVLEGGIKMKQALRSS